MLTIIGIKNCSTIKKTLAWLDEQGVDYSFRDVKKEPLNDEELAGFAMRVGIDTLVNRRGMKWRSLGLSGKDLSDEELLELLAEHQTMIKRPLVSADEAAMVGFDEDALESFIDEYA